MIFEREQTDNLGHLAVIIFGRDTKDNLAKEWGPKNFRDLSRNPGWTGVIISGRDAASKKGLNAWRGATRTRECDHICLQRCACMYAVSAGT
jgi:hypothetical protein